LLVGTPQPAGRAAPTLPFCESLLQIRDNCQIKIPHHGAMKTKFILTVSVLLAASGLASAATNDLPTLLQRGLFEEEANHQLDAAIGDYKEAIAHFDHDRQLAATAIFRLGECYRKLGRTNEAAVQYQRIVREFDDQNQLVTLSRQSLSGMGMSAAPELSSLPDAARHKQQQLLEEEIKVVEHELQLQQTQFKTGILPEEATLATQQKLLELKRQSAALEGDQAVSPATLAAAEPGAALPPPVLLPPDEEKFLRQVKESVQNSPDLVNQQLGLAAENGYVSAAEFLLAHGADVNQNSRICAAARNGNQAMVEMLLSHGAAVDGRDGSGSTPLRYAVEKGFLTICRTLVARGADVNAKESEGMTPLHIAVEHNNLAAAAFLITNQAQIDAKNDREETPLLFAIQSGSIAMSKLLLDNHADANLEASEGVGVASTRVRLNPLDWAIYRDNPEMAKLLLDRHADPNAATLSPRNFREIEFQLGSYQATRQIPVFSGETPLVWATLLDQPHVVEIVKLLLAHGAKPNATDPDGLTALVHAIARGNMEVIRALVEYGADVNALDRDGRPPLARLSSPITETGRLIQALLIKAGADSDYNRRRGIWVCDAAGAPKTELFQCPSNSINHYTLLEALATLYQVSPPPRRNGQPESFGNYGHPDDLVPFPDFARISIHRLDGKRAEVLHVDVADMLQSGDCSKDVALQAGDMIEISKQEHKVADRWYGLSDADVDALNKCLLRTVQIITQGHTNDIALLPSFASASRARAMNFRMPQAEVDAHIPDWLAAATKSRQADTLVRSFFLNTVARDDNVLLNTWDLSKVRLARSGAKMTFDLTSNPPPEVWLEKGDVIEIPELGEAAPATESK
jgi:ankyrin repeat protein